MIKLKLIAIAIILPIVGLSQLDFDHYNTITSKGKIPEDFSKVTHDKVQEDLENGRDELSKSEEEIFINGIHYSIDNILHSGQVVYGDELTIYLNAVADKILSKNKKLRKELRFYILKSNEANAFSTDQGIVFFTTGLISQLTSEAQLAFVIAHEVSHYTESHVQETFDWKTKNSRESNRIEKLSTYSKEKEFEADRLAVAMCHDAGYSDDEIMIAFDVLMYSYLPFDEIEFPHTYFNSAKVFIPEDLFPDKVYEIKADEDYDDNLSSHPNIRKRKDSVIGTIEKYKDWGTHRFLLDEKRFYEARNIARFESVRSSILDTEFANALYSIFILEREFPNSSYLNKMKAQAWMGLLIYKENNSFSQVVKSSRELEGASADLHYFLKKLKKQELATLAIRQIYDAHQKDIENKEILAIYKKAIEYSAWMDKFELADYSKKTFDEAYADYVKLNSDTISTADTLEVSVDTKEAPKKLSKYDRIKKKRDVNEVEYFDSTNYYQYILSDVIIDEEFLKLFNAEMELVKEHEKEEEEFKKLSARQRRAALAKDAKNESKLGMKEVVLVEPKVISYKKNGVDYVKSDELETLLSESMDWVANDLDITVHHLDRRTLNELGTDGYNQRTALMTLLDQIANNDGNDFFPVDYKTLTELRENYGATTKVMFTLVAHEYRPNINVGSILGLVWVFPAIPMYLSHALLTANNMEITYVVFDLETAEAEFVSNTYYQSPVKKWYLRSQLHTVFNELNDTPQ